MRRSRSATAASRSRRGDCMTSGARSRPIWQGSACSYRRRKTFELHQRHVWRRARHLPAPRFCQRETCCARTLVPARAGAGAMSWRRWLGRCRHHRRQAAWKRRPAPAFGLGHVYQHFDAEIRLKGRFPSRGRARDVVTQWLKEPAGTCRTAGRSNGALRSTGRTG